MLNNAYTIKDLAAFLALVGLPPIFSIIVYLFKKIRVMVNEIDVLCRAQKAQMRSQLLHQYYVYKLQGYISSDDLDDWCNQYKAYHSLVGDNAVLDARKTELINMNSVPDGNN